MVRAALAAAAILLAAVAISFIASGRGSRRGCIDLTVPYSIGGQEVHSCGAAARTTCLEVGTPAGFSGAAGRAVAHACRKAGLAVG